MGNSGPEYFRAFFGKNDFNRSGLLHLGYRTVISDSGFPDGMLSANFLGGSVHPKASKDFLSSSGFVRCHNRMDLHQSGRYSTPEDHFDLGSRFFDIGISLRLDRSCFYYKWRSQTIFICKIIFTVFIPSTSIIKLSDSRKYSSHGSRHHRD